jgi:hypothetical protein
MILVELQLPSKTSKTGGDQETSIWTKIKRVDFLGAIALSVTLLAALIVLDLGGQQYAFSHPLIIAGVILACVSAVAFYLVETYVANEPIFPPRLLGNFVVVTSYNMLSMQNIAQTAVSCFGIQNPSICLNAISRSCSSPRYIIR